MALCFMLNNEHDFLQKAMQAYDNPACICLEEFQLDLNGYSTIKRAIKKYLNDRENLQRLVNHIIIFYNCFGKDSTELLIYKIKEPELRSVLLPIIHMLGWVDPDMFLVNIDDKTVADLQEIFQ